MRRRERGGKKGRRGGGWTRGKHVWGMMVKGREGVEETSRIVAGSEDVRLVVCVLHVLRRTVICRQTRTKRLAAMHCATVVSCHHVSDASLQLILRNLEKSLVGNPMESLPPGKRIHKLLCGHNYRRARPPPTQLKICSTAFPY